LVACSIWFAWLATTSVWLASGTAGLTGTGFAAATTVIDGAGTATAACCVVLAANGDIALIWSVISGRTNITPMAPIAQTPAPIRVRCAAVRKTLILPDAASSERNRFRAFGAGAFSVVSPIRLGNIFPPLSARQSHPPAVNAHEVDRLLDLPCTRMIVCLCWEQRTNGGVIVHEPRPGHGGSRVDNVVGDKADALRKHSLKCHVGPRTPYCWQLSSSCFFANPTTAFGRIVLTGIYPVNNIKASFYNFYVLKNDIVESKP
jgi:hypothetical protein